MHQVLASGYTSAFSVKDRIYIFCTVKNHIYPYGLLMSRTLNISATPFSSLRWPPCMICYLGD